MLKEITKQLDNDFVDCMELAHDLSASTKLSTNSFRNLCLNAGAADVGFVEIGRKEVDDQREDLLYAFPRTKTIVCIVHRLHNDSMRSPLHHVADNELKYVKSRLYDVSHKIMVELEKSGVRGVIEEGNFPMNANVWPGKIFIASLKPLAVAAGLGHMGLNRMILHPQFGSFINISALLIDREMTEYSKPIENNPCLDCKLCASTCPTGAIANDGHFTFSSCLTHNYREKLGGFSDWVEQVVESKSAKDYRERVSDQETLSMWQSLSYGANSKCDYCMAVCPAGRDVIGLYNKPKTFVKDIVKPLQAKKENVYVVPGSDAESHVTQRFPHKNIRHVGNGVRPDSIRTFVNTLPLLFQRKKSEGLNSTFHFTFTGDEELKATVTIKNMEITVENGFVGEPDISISADSNTWLKFLVKERNIVWALLRRKVKVKGPIRLLLAFGKCFPM